MLADVGWDVERDGLFGAPRILVLVGASAHTTVLAALRMLGFGTARSVRRVTRNPTVGVSTALAVMAVILAVFAQIATVAYVQRHCSRSCP